MSFLEKVEAKIHGLKDHPLSERLKLLKKKPKATGPSTVIAYDFPHDENARYFKEFKEFFATQGLELKRPLDGTPHVTLSYIINATEEEVEEAKRIAGTIQTPLEVVGVSFLLGRDKKIYYIALDLQVTPEFRRVFNEIEKLVGEERVVDFRTIWMGHIPHASIGILEEGSKYQMKTLQKALNQKVKKTRLKFKPKFVEVHLNTQRRGPFYPEMIDWQEIA